MLSAFLDALLKLSKTSKTVRLWLRNAVKIYREFNGVVVFASVKVIQGEDNISYQICEEEKHLIIFIMKI